LVDQLPTLASYFFPVKSNGDAAMREWDGNARRAYSQHAAKFISGYSMKIDCAHLAVETLIDFAFGRLPIAFYCYDEARDDWRTFFSSDFKSKVDFSSAAKPDAHELWVKNTAEIKASELEPGDLIMTQRPNYPHGHTRIVYSVDHSKDPNNPYVVYYQGNLPIEAPKKSEDYLEDIKKRQDPYDPTGAKTSLRRWLFDLYNEKYRKWKQS
jgi:hypothetical protein